MTVMGLTIALIGGATGLALSVRDRVPVDGVAAATLTVTLGLSMAIIGRPVLQILTGIAFLLAGFAAAHSRAAVLAEGPQIPNIFIVWYLVPVTLSGLYAVMVTVSMLSRLRARSPR